MKSECIPFYGYDTKNLMIRNNRRNGMVSNHPSYCNHYEKFLLIWVIASSPKFHDRALPRKTILEEKCFGVSRAEG